MGRKIPGKKHRKIKDPFKQNQNRLEKVRLKINNPPSNVDEQEIPKSLLKIMELKKQVKKEVVKKPKRKRKPKESVLSLAKVLDKESVHKGMTKPNPFIPNVVQRPNESEKSFLGRVHSVTQDLINEVQFEEKFGVEIKKNLETGEVLEVKNIKRKNKTSKKKKLVEKRKEKLNKKKESLQNVKDFSQLKDKVEFGEVVHRPPDLSKTKVKDDKIKKPKFSNLLLNFAVKNSTTNTKNLPSNILKEKMENERKFIVENYRRLKKNKVN